MNVFRCKSNTLNLVKIVSPDPNEIFANIWGRVPGMVPRVIHEMSCFCGDIHCWRIEQCDSLSHPTICR